MAVVLSLQEDRKVQIVLWVSLALNLITMIGIIALGAIFSARLESMDVVYRRCAVGIRWVEVSGHKGKIIVVEKETFNDLKESQYELPDLSE